MMATETQYARVHGGRVVAVSALVNERPGADWMPIENVDERPFDAARHWRLKPRYEVHGDVVHRVSPIVDKSWEHA